jgi:4-amino-4-deoxy-L-arabinose transferase-like glycosyltransferase
LENKLFDTESAGLNSDRPPTPSHASLAVHWASEKAMCRRMLPWLMIGMGIVLRLTQYVFNRSLWYDEANLALNILDRSVLGLFQPLDHDQGAPIGFLLLEKIAVGVLGKSEYVLRLIPFLSGLISLFLFYAVAKRYISKNALLLALYLFAISDTLIYYSSEVKPYSSDVLVILSLFLIISRATLEKLTFSQSLALGIAGAISIWLSYPAIFVLFTIGICIIVAVLQQRTLITYNKLLIIFALWITSMILNYLIQLRYLANNGDMVYYWRNNNAFMPFPPRSISDLEWFFFKSFDIFSDPGGLKLFGLELSGIGVTLFLIGCYTLFYRNRSHLFILISPLVVTLFVSAFERYPFSGRLLLFIVPSLFLLIAEGAAYLQVSSGNKSSIVSVLLIAVLLMPLSLNAVHYLANPRTREELRPALQYIQGHKQPADTVYVYQGAEQAFVYYSKVLGLDGDFIAGVDARGDWHLYIDDINKLRNKKRIWVLFSHVRTIKGIDEEQFLLYHLDALGKQLDAFSTEGASAYLYDLDSAHVR